MQAGRLRKRITFQVRGNTLDSFGGQSESWTTVTTLWGEILPVGGRELQAAEATQQQVSHIITVRYPGSALTITPAHRALWGGRIFNITSVVNVQERNSELQIPAYELLNQG